jgi:hypothetical protein
MLTNEVNNDPMQLLAALRARGVRCALVFTAQGMDLDVQGRVSQSDRAALAAHREGLVAALLAEARLAAAQRDDDAAAEGRAVEWGVSAAERWNERGVR